MRLSAFYSLMADEFGEIQSQVILKDLALLEYQDRTPIKLLEAGEDPQGVWLAICRALGVPPERWLGLDKKAKNRHAD